MLDTFNLITRVETGRISRIHRFNSRRARIVAGQSFRPFEPMTGVQIPDRAFYSPNSGVSYCRTQVMPPLGGCRGVFETSHPRTAKSTFTYLCPTVSETGLLDTIGRRRSAAPSKTPDVDPVVDASVVVDPSVLDNGPESRPTRPGWPPSPGRLFDRPLLARRRSHIRVERRIFSRFVGCCRQKIIYPVCV